MSEKLYKKNVPEAKVGVEVGEALILEMLPMAPKKSGIVVWVRLGNFGSYLARVKLSQIVKVGQI